MSLEALARGLRQAGGVISPDVAKVLAHEEQAAQEQQRRLALVQYQQKIADEREKALAGVVGPALQGGDFEAAAKAAATSGAPGGTKMAMDLLGKAEERKARAENYRLQIATKEIEMRQRHLDKLEELRQKGADAMALQAEKERAQKERDEFLTTARQELGQFMASLRPQRQLQITTDSQGNQLVVNPDGTTKPLTGPDGKPVKGKPNERSLPPSVVNELTDRGTTAQDFVKLSETFDDKFGGYKSEKIGDAVNWAKRTFGDDSNQAQWWQGYQEKKNVIRNKLFGSALTATEKVEFDKAQINPGMDSGEIRKNLGRQKDAALKAARKLAGAYKAGGYSSQQIEAALGIPLEGSVGNDGWKVEEVK